MLDVRVRATLDKSVPQIGAPQAWQAGYTGTGVKVAVLDTGINSHPDLSGVLLTGKSFVPSEPSVLDGNGHGTHVAATIASRGVGSTPARKGWRPGPSSSWARCWAATATGSCRRSSRA
ncbi:S8 family serine peptidase [Actinomadura yumaensis]|uniref:S8 family serine peptidase n=1 Tax=Actinomadura yumaensis TaxID=111807 RepID=UPI00362325CE